MSMLVIEVIDYPVYSRIGFYPNERLSGQEILVSITAKLKPDFGPKGSDDLKQTLNYAKITEIIDTELKSKELKLIETACHILGQRLLKDFWMIDAVDVKVEKTVFPPGTARGSRIRVNQLFSRKT
jgi:dihydroneopterin aldolase